jgi:putative toxin-antitoxin system antitoxin component (TIGR02293 family)
MAKSVKRIERYIGKAKAKQQQRKKLEDVIVRPKRREDAGTVFGREPTSFTVTRLGKEKVYTIRSGYGYYIESIQKAKNLVKVSELIEHGIAKKEIETLIEYLELKVPEIAKAAAVSSSTVSRWDPETSIGVAGSSQFFKIDELIKKGVDLFGGPEEFKGWLNAQNIALGNQVPLKLVTSQIGIELVDEALDALHYGNAM